MTVRSGLALQVRKVAVSGCNFACSASWILTPSLQGVQGVTGGVEAMPDFLEKFFPDVYAAQQTKSVDPYCSFDSQKLSAFTSTLFLSGEAARFGHHKEN